jgi:hypothetical protein
MLLVASARPKWCNVSIAIMPRISSNVSGDSIAPLIGQTENGYLRMVDFHAMGRRTSNGLATFVSETRKM